MTATDDLPAIRPLLRRDAVLMPNKNGGVLRTEDTAVALRGPAAYRLLARLRPYLTGKHSLIEICAGLAAPERAAVHSVVRGLVDRGVVVDAGSELGGRFEAQLGYLAHVVEAPGEAFRRFRTANILLTGNGTSLHAAALGLLRNGAAGLVVTPDETSWPYADELRAEGVLVDGGARPTADLIVHCADRGGPGPVIRLLDAAQAPLLAMAIVDGRAVLGPVTRPGTVGCWCCARPDRGKAVPLTATVARMLGGTVAFEVFRTLAGVPSADTDGAALIQDLRTLRSWRVPVTGCPRCAGVPARSAEPDLHPAAPAVVTLDDHPPATVGEYAKAAHRSVPEPLPAAGFVADWANRPPIFPVYPDAPLIPFPEAGAPPGLDRVGRLLRSAYGPMARRLRFDSSQSSAYFGSYPTADWRRGAISGGGLYPLGIYWVASPGGPLDPGIYHYSPGHHALERIADGDGSDRVRRAVRHPDAERTGQFLLVSLRFWRNAFKYGPLGYHIGMMDVGALLGTLYQLDGQVRPLLWFDDEDLNALLRLDTAEESVLAVVPLTWPDALETLSCPPAGPAPAPFETSRTVVRFGWTQRVHRTTMLAGRPRPEPGPTLDDPTGADRPALLLPEPVRPEPVEPAGILLRRRRSSFGLLSGSISSKSLASVLAWTARTGILPHDLGPCSTRLSVLAINVDAIAPGGYRYDPRTHTLRPAAPVTDWPEALSRIDARLPNYTLDQAAAVIAVSGDVDAVMGRLGPRGYRVLAAEVGSVVQAGYLAAAAAGLGRGAVLSLDHVALDEVLGFTGTSERTILCLLLGGELDGGADFEHRLD